MKQIGAGRPKSETLKPETIRSFFCSLELKVLDSSFKFENKSSGPEVAGFRVQGAGFRVQGSGFRVRGSGFRNQRRGNRGWLRIWTQAKMRWAAWFRVQGLGFRVYGVGFGVECFGLRCQGSGLGV